MQWKDQGDNDTKSLEISKWLHIEGSKKNLLCEGGTDNCL